MSSKQNPISNIRASTNAKVEGTLTGQSVTRVKTGYKVGGDKVRVQVSNGNNTSITKLSNKTGGSYTNKKTS